MTSEQLAEALARIDGREPALIESHLDSLRAARMIGARGPLNAGDVASALIGLNAAHRASEAASVARTFRALPAPLMSGLESERYLPDAVIEARNFGEAVEAVLETAPEIERAFEAFVFDALAHDPASSLGTGGARAAMRLCVQIHSGSYKAGAISVQTNLSRSLAYGRKYRALEAVHETVFVDPETANRGLDELMPERRVSVVLGLPAFLALHEALHIGESVRPGPRVPGEAAIFNMVANDDR